MVCYDKLLKDGEKTILALRGLYKEYGYLGFKMGKFEEYALYAKHKEFLVDEGILTFMNADGKLMALKPDVTLSIAKNSPDIKGFVQKLYYDENVYRVSKNDNEFKEITQTGIECMGDITQYDVCESVILAVKSLTSISNDVVLDISHMGIIESVLYELSLSQDERKQVLLCLSQKNSHRLSEILDSINAEYTAKEKLLKLVSVYGAPGAVLEKLNTLSLNAKGQAAASELKLICEALKSEGLIDKARLDFSLVSDTGYYDGIMFRGFIKGLPSSVLSGGRYDALMHKMGKRQGAIGFAVYLDMLSLLNLKKDDYDIDCALICDENEPAQNVLEAANCLRKQGYYVSVMRRLPENVSVRAVFKLKDKEVIPGV